MNPAAQAQAPNLAPNLAITYADVAAAADRGVPGAAAVPGAAHGAPELGAAASGTP